MSSVTLQVDLPQYSHSFSVHIKSTDTINDVKQEIARSCPGSPRSEGQRLIWKGRVLADSEQVSEVWQNPDELCIVQLAVNPWAWTSQPPSIPSSSQSRLTPDPDTPPSSTSASRGGDHTNMFLPVSYPISPYFHSRYATVFYIDVLHTSAIESLTLATTSAYGHLSASALQEARSIARAILTSYGYTWPLIFDEQYPAESQGGVKYDIVYKERVPYYQLLTPNDRPTPRQVHALRVLTYTFPILSLPATDPGIPTQLLIGQVPSNQINANINIAMPPGLQNGIDPQVQIQIRAIPLRALLTPILLLCLRTLLLLYFFSPARKPVFGIILGAWVLYEAWGAVRGAIGDLNPNEGRQAAQNNAADNRNIPRAGDGVPPALTAQASAFINHLAHLNLSREARALTTAEDARAMAEPSVLEKIKLFISLIFLSFHPDIWNRRRTALREREGNVRTELAALDAVTQDQDAANVDYRVTQSRQRLTAQNARRPSWVLQYVERVRRGEWVDD